MSPTGPLGPRNPLQVITLEAATVLLDLRTGRLDTLMGPAHDVWQALAAANGRLPPARTLDLADETTETVVARLLDRGLLRAVDTARPWPAPVRVPDPPPSWGSDEAAARLASRLPVPWQWRLPAGVGLLITLACRHLGRRTRRFARMLALATLASRWAARPASLAQAEHATRAVRSVARVVPARVACLEESVAATLTLALNGYQAGWRHGVAADPIRFHAWIEVGGQPVDEPPSTSLCTPVLRIPEPATREPEGSTWRSR